MDRDAVIGYVDRAEAVLSASPQLDEANTKAAVLREFLEILGWQIPTNTQLEYSVEAFGQTYKVDYALILEGIPVAFLEAKGADTALTDRHDEQLSSYMTNKNVTYGILTNGKQYRFFQRRVDASNVDVQKVGEAALNELPTRLAVLKAYEKHAIESGESGKILGRINELRAARRTLEAQKDDLAAEISDVLADHVSDVIFPLAESQAKELIDRLAADIDAEIDADDGANPVTASRDRTIDSADDHIAGQISRAEITGNGDARVAVFPTKESGLTFLKENNAWGFVRLGSTFEYAAMYVTGDVRQVQYVATVRDIVSPDEANLSRPVESYTDSAKIDDDKVVVRFQPDSLYQLTDPIPFETKYPQGHRYTTLDSLRTAKTTDDLL